jgi:hypothetical protein
MIRVQDKIDNSGIVKNRCVSCYNREKEVLKQANAKSQLPVRHAEMAYRSMSYVVTGNRLHTLRSLSISMDELVFNVLRDSPDPPAFGRGVGAHLPFRQRELF